MRLNEVIYVLQTAGPVLGTHLKVGAVQYRCWAGGDRRTEEAHSNLFLLLHCQPHPPNINTRSSVSLLSFPVLGLSHPLSMNNMLELKGAPETDSPEVEVSLIPVSSLPPPNASEGCSPPLKNYPL